MKATELRIGNLVRDHYAGTHEVKSINKYFVETTSDIDDELTNHKQGVKNLKPIPLTEEWLLKCQFNFEELGFNDLSVARGIFSGKFHFVIDRYYKRLQYLHQLQNLYFALTGEELTITE